PHAVGRTAVITRVRHAVRAGALPVSRHPAAARVVVTGDPVEALLRRGLVLVDEHIDLLVLHEVAHVIVELLTEIGERVVRRLSWFTVEPVHDPFELSAELRDRGRVRSCRRLPRVDPVEELRARRVYVRDRGTARRVVHDTAATAAFVPA